MDYNDIDAYWYHIKSIINEGVSMFIPKQDKYAWKKEVNLASLGDTRSPRSYP